MYFKGSEHLKQEPGLKAYLLTAYETYRNGMTNAVDLTVELNDQQDEVIWKFVNDHLQAYDEGRVKELDFVQLVQAYKAVTGLFGWAGLASRQNPHLRNPLASAMA